MKFRLPRNCGAISHAGRALDTTAGACVELDEAQAELLRPHGLRPFDEPDLLDATRIATMGTLELLAALEARGIAVPRNANDKTLRGLLRQALGKMVR